MNEIKYITLDDQQFEIVDGAARASLQNKANKNEIPNVSEFITSNDLPDLTIYYTKSEIDNIIGDVDSVLEALGV